jgi:ABC-type uncharacterized transport system permease subunit
LISQVWKAISRSSILYSLVSLLLAFAVGAVILLMAGYNPLEGYAAMFVGAFGDGDAWANTLAKSTPLIFTGLAVAIAFRGGLFNIGAEGQLYLGAFAAALVGIYFTGLPGILQAVLALLAAVIVGALWAGLAGFLKVAFRAHEVIVTIMLNYIAISLTDYLVSYTFKAEGMVPRTEEIAAAVQLPILVQHSQLNVGLFIAVGMSLLMYWFFRYTVYGYEIRALGLNASAAQTGGISIKNRLILTMLISGGVAALAGAVEVMGVHGYFIKGISPGFGFDGIAVAVLARNHPIGVLISAILFGALRSGSMTMDRTTDIPGDFVIIIQSLVIIFVAIPWVVKKFRTSKEGGTRHG